MDIEKVEKAKERLKLDMVMPLHGSEDTIVIIEDIQTVLSELEKQDNKIKELEGRCRNLDKEAQSYLEELMGDSTLKNRTIKQLNSELEKKDKRLNRQFKLLQKRDKEIEELKADNSHQWEERCKLTFELEKKDKEYEELTEASKELCKTVNLMKKVINEMAKHIHLSGDYECLNKECEDDGDISCEDCIKEYFYKKVKETKDNGSTRGI